MVIEYDSNDAISDIIDALDKKCEQVVSYLEIKSFGDKVSTIIYNDLNSFREKYIEGSNYYKSIDDVPEWICGFSRDNYICVLSFSELHKLKAHANDTMSNYLNFLTHEFIHACHTRLNPDDNVPWVSEGLATNLSNQYDDKKNTFKIDVTREDIRNRNCNYSNYYLMFKYVLDNYDKEFVLKLLSDYDLQESITDDVYDAVAVKK